MKAVLEVQPPLAEPKLLEALGLEPSNFRPGWYVLWEKGRSVGTWVRVTVTGERNP